MDHSPLSQYLAEANLADVELADVYTWPDSVVSNKKASVLVLLIPADKCPANVLPNDCQSGLGVILTKRSERMQHHAGQWSLPGGMADDTETPAATALRETQEEVGIDPQRIRLLGRLSSVHTVSQFEVVPCVGIYDDEQPLSFLLNTQEVAAIQWLPLSFLKIPENFQRSVAGSLNPDGKIAPRDFLSLATYSWQSTAAQSKAEQATIASADVPVWGATAHILFLLSSLVSS